MDRDDINRIILDNELFHGTMALGVVMDANHLEKFANLVAAAEREKVAEWMMARAYATGHGETTEELLEELGWQIEENIAREREACALEVEKAGMEGYGTLAAAAAIRARGDYGL